MRSAREILSLAKRGMRKPPRVIARRLLSELSAETDRFLLPHRARRFKGRALLAATGAPDLEALWTRLAHRPFPAQTSPMNPDLYALICPGDRA